MAKTKPSTIPPERLKLYDQLVREFPEVERKGATMPYTSVNGNMFSFLNPEGELALRLGPEERETFIQEHRTKLFEAHGTVMKEYVHVPQTLFARMKVMKHYFAQSLVYASSLKKKGTKRESRASDFLCD